MGLQSKLSCLLSCCVLFWLHLGGTSAVKYHYIFSAECTTYMDWQSLGLHYSWKKAGSPGQITRLLSCSEEQLKDYRWLDMMPTHVHPPLNRYHNGDWYPPYNLPGSVLHWVTHNSTDADFVIKLDGDMILRRPITVEMMGASKGNAVGGLYGYLKGVDNGMSQMFLPEHQQKICSKVGGWVLMHMDDMRRVAPQWLHFTEKVREHPPCWNMTGDAYVSLANPKPWISEMYGFVFGCASVDLKVREDGEHMLYPGYVPWSDASADPAVLHYGLKFHVGEWKYDKHDWAHQDMMGCSATRPGLLFPPPPKLESLQGTRFYPKSEKERKGDELCIETISTLNEALAEVHKAQGCAGGRLTSDKDRRVLPEIPPGEARRVMRRGDTDAREPKPKSAEVENSWTIFGTVTDAHDGDKVVLLKSLEGRQVECGVVPIESQPVTGLTTTEQVYKSKLGGGISPCFLKDGDQLSFRVRSMDFDTGQAEDLPTPEWTLATFAANMQQQVPVVILRSVQQSVSARDDRAHTLKVGPDLGAPDTKLENSREREEEVLTLLFKSDQKEALNMYATAPNEFHAGWLVGRLFLSAGAWGVLVGIFLLALTSSKSSEKRIRSGRSESNLLKH